MSTQVNQLDFTGQQVFIGIDVHKKTWSIATCTKHTNPSSWPTTIHPPFAQNVKKHLDKKYPKGQFRSAYEAGFCGFWPHQKLTERGIHNIVVHAADVPTTDKERKQKEDRRDARKLAKALKYGAIKGIYVPSEQALEDRSIVRERFSVAKSLRRIKGQIRSHLIFHNLKLKHMEHVNTKHWSGRFIGYLEELCKVQEDMTLKLQIARLHEMRKLKLEANRAVRTLGKSERHQKRFALLKSVPGIGAISAMVLITEIVDMHRFPRFIHLCSYVGLIPTTYSSGEKENRGEMTKRRNKRLRTALIESSWTAMRNDPELMIKYHHYKERVGSKEAIIRIARILLRRIRCIWVNEKPYRKVEIG